MIDDDTIPGDEATIGLARRGLAYIAELAAAPSRQAIADYLGDPGRMKATRYAFALLTDLAEAAAMRIDPKGLSTDLRTWRRQVTAAPNEGQRAVAWPHVEAWTPPGLNVPHGYTVRGRVTDADEAVVCSAPVCLSAVARDVEAATVRVTVRWRSRGRWHALEVDRAAIADARRMIGLASKGFPVNSGNAGALVAYLAAFEAENEARLPEERVVSRLGWHGEAFVLPHRTLGGPTLRLVADDGQAQRAAALRPHGTWEGWCAVVREVVASYPSCLLAVYASAASALLTPLGLPGFAVDWSGNTSRGKTTTLRVGSSVWGRPEEGGGFVSWAAPSIVSHCAMAAFLHSIPVCLDDTRRGRPNVIGPLVYAIPSGIDPQRGNADGTVRVTRTWRTVLLSTGEASLGSFSDGAGAEARVLHIQGAPLGDETQEHAADAEAIRARLLQHYGHLGERVVEYVIAHRAALRTRHAELLAAYTSAASTAVGHRVAEYVATIALAAEVCTVLGVPGDASEAVAVAAAALSQSETAADKPAQALHEVAAWARMNRGNFIQGDTDSDAVRTGGFLGFWHPTHLYVQTSVLRDRLKAMGFDAPAVLESWRRTAVIDCESGRRERSVRLPWGEKVRMTAFPWAVLED